MSDGPGFSPDGGNYWEKDGILYWEDGDVTDLNQPGIAVRRMPMPTGVDYSLWTEAHRSEVKEKYRIRRIAATDQREARAKECERLVESARKKVTDEEWDALVGYLRDGWYH